MSTQFLQGRTLNSRTLTIASVYPEKRIARRDYHPEMAGGRYLFVLEAAPKGEYATLTIPDCWELIETDQGKIGNMSRRPELVRCEDIVGCLLSEWAINIGGTRTGHRPGIMRIAGDAPTEAELVQLNAMQAAYFDGLIHEGNGLAAQHDWKNISSLHRLAAVSRGHEAAWVTNLGEGKEKKECFYCASKIEARAKFCKECRQFQPGFESIAAAIPATEVHPMPGIPKSMKPPIPPPIREPRSTAA